MSQDPGKACEIHSLTPTGAGMEKGNGHLDCHRLQPPSHPRPSPLHQPAKIHPLGKKLSIMRSPRGFTARAPICWRSRRLWRQSNEAKEADGGVRERVGPENQWKKVFRSALLTSSSPFPPCPGLGTGGRDGAGWLARLWERRRWDEPPEDSQPLSPDPMCIGVRCRNPGSGDMCGEPRGIILICNLPFHPPTLYNRVFHLPTPSEASTIRRRLTGGDAGRGESLPPPQAQVRSQPGWREFDSRKHYVGN